jgi:hypothetical protein
LLLGVATRADDIAESYVIGGHIRNRRAKLENFGWPRSIGTVPVPWLSILLAIAASG